MKSPRVEGPPVLQPVTGSPASVLVSNRDSIETPVDEHVSDEENPSTPPMPILVEGEDFGDEDASSFEIVEEMTPNDKLEKTEPNGQEPPPPLTNGVPLSDAADAPPDLTHYSSDELINGDHEEPVLEKFFRLFTPGVASPQRRDNVSDLLAPKRPDPAPSLEPVAKPAEPEAPPDAPAAAEVPPEPAVPSVGTSKRRRQAGPKTERSPSAKRTRKVAKDTPAGAEKPRGRPAAKSKAGEVFDFDSDNEAGDGPSKSVRKSPQRRPAKAKAAREEKSKGSRKGAKDEGKERQTPAAAAIETRYLRSPFIISTAESDSIMSRFQVVNPAFRDAASVNVLDHPFKHSVKLPPHAGLTKSAWVCVFCGLGTSFSDLGCLFGPYYIDFNKFTAHADLVCTAEANAPCPVEKPSRGRQPKAAAASSLPASPCVPSTATSSMPASPAPPASGQLDVKGTSTPSEAGSEPDAEESEPKDKRPPRRLSRGSNGSPRLSSISSFRSSKTRNRQTLIAAKDVRRCSVDSDKGSSSFKQLDIAAMFFPTGEQPDEKEAAAKVNGKEPASRRRSDAGKEAAEEAAKKTAAKPGSSAGKSEAGVAPKPGRKAEPPKASGAKSKAGKAAADKAAAAAKKTRAAAGGTKAQAEPPSRANCQSKPARARERRKSSEVATKQADETRIAANGEVWVHLECVMWASGTYLNGKQIVGLEEALSEALQTVCRVCHLRGAILACVQRGCDRTFHYYCAVRDDCYLDKEQFCIYCSKHKKKNVHQESSYLSGATNQPLHF